MKKKKKTENKKKKEIGKKNEIIGKKKGKNLKKTKNEKQEKIINKLEREHREIKDKKEKKVKETSKNQKNKKNEKRKYNNIEIKIDSISFDDENILKEKSIKKLEKKNYNKRRKKNNSMKKGQIKNKNNYSDDDNIRSIASIRSKSDGEEIDREAKYYKKRNNKKKNNNNNRKKSNKIKNEKKEKEEEIDLNKIFNNPVKKSSHNKSNSYNTKNKIIKDPLSSTPSPPNTNNSNNYTNQRGHSSNNKSYHSSIKKIMWGSSSSLENTVSFSIHSDSDDRIKIKKDPSYFYKYSHYIKYHPLDQYLPPIPFNQKKSIKSKIVKTEKLNFDIKTQKENMKIDNNDENSDSSDISSLFYEGYDEEDELPPILSIPRIKPMKEEHIKLIEDKLEKDGIKIHHTDNESIRKEEESLYIGSFGLYDDKSKIKVLVPVYKEHEVMNQFLANKNLKIIEFKEDNDIDTDDEQVTLETNRSNEALLRFMKKIEKDKNYVIKSLNRKPKE